MDLMSFILSGMFVADVLDEYDIQRKEQEGSNRKWTQRQTRK